MLQRVMSRFLIFCRKFFVSQCRKFLYADFYRGVEPFSVSLISGIEKVLIRGEYHDFPSKFLSHCTEIFHWRTFWCFRKILLSKIFMHRRGAGHHGFVDIFRLTGPKRKAL